MKKHTPSERDNPTTTELNRLRDVEQRLLSARLLAEEQANDPALWFVAVRASEAYLQAALRKLAAAVEGEWVNQELWRQRNVERAAREFKKASLAYMSHCSCCSTCDDEDANCAAGGHLWALEFDAQVRLFDALTEN